MLSHWTTECPVATPTPLIPLPPAVANPAPPPNPGRAPPVPHPTSQQAHPSAAHLVSRPAPPPHWPPRSPRRPPAPARPRHRRRKQPLSPSSVLLLLPDTELYRPDLQAPPPASPSSSCPTLAPSTSSSSLAAYLVFQLPAGRRFGLLLVVARSPPQSSPRACPPRLGGEKLCVRLCIHCNEQQVKDT